MEKISAACAMEWSMELEMSLRSKKPGQAVKAIQEIGKRLQLLSREPKPTMAVYNMFNLVPGEDALFTNTIFLRLADAFRLGDKDTRHCIVRVFLSEFKNGGKQKKGKRYASKEMVQNPMELLKRVKIVFDTGDVESRALALVLFGCWADFAKDSIHIRYLILSHLVSSEILEVKASLFSAGCFSELSVDFASVALDMVCNIVISHEASLATRLAGARVFAKMGCSYSIANKAHQIGVKLLLDSSDEDFSAAMLVSLSKLAAKSSILLSDQMNILLLYLNQEKTFRMQATTLRCLHFMLTRGFCVTPIRLHLIKLLLRMVDETELPSAMQCEAMQILQLMHVSDLDFEDIHVISHMSTIIEKAARSSVAVKSILAIRILIDLSINLRGRSDMEADGNHISSLPTIFSILFDRIISLVKPGLDVCESDAKVVREIQTPLDHLLFLGREDLDICVILLDKIRLFIKFLVDTQDRNSTTVEAESPVHDISFSLVNKVQNFSLNFIEKLSEVGPIMKSEIFYKVKLVVESVHSCRLFEPYIHLKYSVLHSRIIFGFVLKQNAESSSVCDHFGASLFQQLVEYEILSLELADKMLRNSENWDAYKAAIFAVYHGAWVTASFIFGQLIDKVQSDSFYCWFKALAKFAESEMKIQLFLVPNLGSTLLTLLQKREFHFQFFEDNLDEPNCFEGLVGAYDGLRSSEETLKSMSILGNSFCFQRRFLDLRAKLMRSVVDAGKVLGSVERLDFSRRISELSIHFKNLADEYDLISMSVIGMGIRSSKIISALALSCSMLAFTTAFALFVSNLTGHETIGNLLESSSTFVERIFVENLVERLWFVDQETCSNLCLILGASKQCMDCNLSHSRNQILDSSGEIRDVLEICRHAISAIVALRNEAKGPTDREILSRIENDGFQLVSKTITKWMHVPFRIPKYFFKMRPCILSELFAYNADARNLEKLTVLPGFHLSINLGIQLHNLPRDLSVNIKKLYCIVCSSASFRDPQSNETDNNNDICMVAMNKKLLHYVTEEKIKHSTGYHFNHCCIDSDDEIVYGFARFELNERGSGFSNCLLNVSNFSVGCYRIYWHSCYVDKQGCYWSLIPQNAGPIFTVQESSVKIHTL